MITMFMPWLKGYWHRVWHALFCRHTLEDVLADWGDELLVLCSCGDTWVEAEKL